jgi:hypothetical protein
MRQLFFVMLTYCMITSCNTDISKKDSQDSITTDVSEKNSKIEEKDFYGTWIDADYLKAIQDKKSVFNNQEYPAEYIALNVGKENPNDRNPKIIGFNSHEGTFNKEIVFDTNNQVFKSINNDDEIEPRNFNLSINQTNQLDFNLIKPKKTIKFKKAKNNIETELRKAIIAGKYVTGDNVSFEFEDTGKLNFKDYKYYEVTFDFVEMPEYDTIICYKTTGGSNLSNADIYKYSFSNGKLILEFVKSNWEEYDHKLTGEKIFLSKK